MWPKRDEGVIPDKLEDGVADAVETVADVLDKQVHRNQRIFRHHRFILGVLGTFGLVSVFYGFERLIVMVPLLRDNPLVVLAVGIVVLFLTGSVYSRLNSNP